MEQQSATRCEWRRTMKMSWEGESHRRVRDTTEAARGEPLVRDSMYSRNDAHLVRGAGGQACLQLRFDGRHLHAGAAALFFACELC